MIPFLIALLIALSIGFASFSVYSKIENRLSSVLKSQVSWIVQTQEKMFLVTSDSKVLWTIIVSTFGLAFFGFYMSYGYGLLTFIFTTFCSFIGYSLPRLWTQYQWQQRIQRFDRQLIDALNLMANSIKSGLNLTQVIQVVVEEMPKPLSQEFGLVLSQQTLGLTLDEALEKMAGRIPSEDLNVAIHSILILRETGGDLAETFDTIANTIRERRKVDGKIKSMTQQGRTQGLMLFLMPFGLATVMYYLNPGFLTPLFTTRLGWMMIMVMLFFQLIGGLWIKKVVTIEV